MARLILTGTTNFYVSPSGNNANDGLSSSTPWQTVQYAASYMRDKVDLSGYHGIVNLAAGTYAENVAVCGSVMGGIQFFIKGDETTPGNVIVGTGGNAPGIYTRDFGVVTVSGVRILGGVQATQCGVVDIGKSGSSTPTVEFGQATGGVHLNAGDSGYINVIGPYAIVGDAYYHASGNTFGRVNLGGQAVTLPGSRTFYAFINSSFYGQIVANGAETYSGAGAGTGSTGYKYQVAQLGILVHNNVTFPGSGTFLQNPGMVFP